MNIVAVVPACNEENTIESTVRALLGIDEIDRVLVIDDGSNDDTAPKALTGGAKVLRNTKNLGKGESLSKVLPRLSCGYLVLADADLGEHASEIKLLLGPVLSGDADISIAAFPRRKKKSGFGIAEGIARAGIKRLTGAHFDSPLSGQRVMSKQALQCILPLEKGYGMEVGMTIDAMRKGLRVIEVQTSMSHRLTKKDLNGFIHRGKQALHISRALVKRLIRERQAC